MKKSLSAAALSVCLFAVNGYAQVTRNVTVRLDATNLFSHPTLGNPNLNIDTGTFGKSPRRPETGPSRDKSVSTFETHQW